MEKRKTLTINLTEEEHKQAKVIAAMAGRTLRDIFLEAIANLKQNLEKENGSK